MLFYKATFYCPEPDRESGDPAADISQQKTYSFLQNRGDHRYLRNYNEMLRKAVATWTTFCFVAERNEDFCAFTVVFSVKANEDVPHLLAAAQKTLLKPAEEADIQLTEITLQDAISLHFLFDRDCFTSHISEPVGDFFRENFHGYHATFLRDSNFRDTIPEVSRYSCKNIRQLSKKFFPDPLFCEEIDRIYSAKNPKQYYGIPVHYDFCFSNGKSGKELIRLLFQALYKNYRLLGQRITYISLLLMDLDEESAWKGLDKLCELSQGTMIVFDLTDKEDVSRKQRRPLNGSAAARDLDRESAEKLFHLMEKYQRSTQFVLLEAPQQDMFHKALEAADANLPMLRFAEQVGDRASALNYLHFLLEECNIKKFVPTDWQSLLTPQESYTAEDVQTDFNFWYSRALQENVYTAYRGCCEQSSKPKSKTDSYAKLQSMVGLTGIKHVIDRILSDFRIRKLRLDAGLKCDSKSLHMLFTGNPGSAKTTCARLLAGIMKERDLLQTGEFVECGRSDLVGQYVGWTAKIVKDKFRKARGGVLFIDEAYALNSDDHFGPEAINTIVQEMENHRDDVIVIFAGYPEPMEDFLKANEGLRSRIAFHLHFPDYNADEMTEIFTLMLKEQGYSYSSGFLEKARSLFSEAVKHTEFGNGRFARNLLEQTVMKQSARLIRLNEESDDPARPLHRKDLITLEADDLAVESVMNYRVEKPAIGFR